MTRQTHVCGVDLLPGHDIPADEVLHFLGREVPALLAVVSDASGAEPEAAAALARDLEVAAQGIAAATSAAHSLRLEPNVEDHEATTHRSRLVAWILHQAWADPSRAGAAYGRAGELLSRRVQELAERREAIISSAAGAE